MSKITPYDFQYAASDAVFKGLASTSENGLVCMPTGTGKSVVISHVVQQIFSMQPHRRIMMLTHVWKLIDQNAQKLYEFWPTAPIGIHSEGLGHRDTMMPIIYGGVQSCCKNVELFGWRDLIIIDEAHLLSDKEDSQYWDVIMGLKKINPNIRVIGFTATPYRMRLGMLTDGGIFDSIWFDITDFESFNRLIAENRLSPLIAKPTETIIDTSQIRASGGELNQKQAESIIDTEENTYEAVKEVIRYGSDRGTWMFFASGIKNSEHIAAMLQSFDIPAAAVHSKLGDAENDNRIKSFDRGELRAIVGANMLTTGYDNQKIDLIADLQATVSPGKHVQKLGRGTRVCRDPNYVKNNCLVLDFVGNISRNGPINDPVKPRKPGESTGDVPIKICTSDKLVQDADRKQLKEGCGAYNHASARFCCNCAEQFSFQSKVEATSRTENPLRLPEAPIYEWVNVKNVTYSRNEGKLKSGVLSPPSIRATYTLGIRAINVFLCFEHVGYPRRIAHDWWKKHSANECPQTIAEFLYRSENGELRIPKRVQVHVNLQYPQIILYEF